MPKATKFLVLTDTVRGIFNGMESNAVERLGILHTYPRLESFSLLYKINDFSSFHFKSALIKIR
jgi:hypothetical protein